MRLKIGLILGMCLIANIVLAAVHQSGLSSSPSSAVLTVGHAATFTASGGTPWYQWDAGGNSGASPSSGFGSTFTVTYSVAGFYSLQLMDSDGTIVYISIQVNSAAPTPTPTPTPAPTPTPTPIVNCTAGPIPAAVNFAFGYLDDIINPPLGDVANQSAADGTNTVWINSSGFTDVTTVANFCIAGICEGSMTGRKAIVEIDSICFDASQPTLLRPDWFSRAQQWATRLAPYTQYIAAIYVEDEPFEVANLHHVNETAHYNDLVTILTQLKQWFPNTPEAVVMQGFTLDNNLPIPPQYDWVGIDFYAPFDGSSNNGKGMLYYENLLESRLLTNQRSILVPYAWLSPTEASGSLYPSAVDRVRQALDYYDLALSHPRVIGFFPFLYQDLSPGLGTHATPGLHGVYQDIFQLLKLKQ